MRRCVYKIKNKETQQYWTGYGNGFGDKGHEFSSWDSAAFELRRQLRYKYDVQSWLGKAEIVEYEISVTETGSTPFVDKVIRSEFYDILSKKFGKPFLKHYFKFCEDTANPHKFKYAIQIVGSDYAEFREAMKGLGFSSRHYKKTDSWLWIENEDVMLRAKLLDHVKQSAYLEQEEELYQQMVQAARKKYGVQEE